MTWLNMGSLHGLHRPALADKRSNSITGFAGLILMLVSSYGFAIQQVYNNRVCVGSAHDVRRH